MKLRVTNRGVLIGKIDFDELKAEYDDKPFIDEDDENAKIDNKT